MKNNIGFWKSGFSNSSTTHVMTFKNDSSNLPYAYVIDTRTGNPSGNFAFPAGDASLTNGSNTYLNSASSMYMCGGGSAPAAQGSAAVYKLNKITNAITRTADMPGKRSSSYGVYSPTAGFVCGGSDWTPATTVAYNSTFKINYSNDAWSVTTSMPFSGKYGWAVNNHKDGFGYMGGGWISNSGPTMVNQHTKLSFASETYSLTSTGFYGTSTDAGKISTDNFGYFTHRSTDGKTDFTRISFPSETFTSLALYPQGDPAVPGAAVGMSKTKGFYYNIVSGGGSGGDGSPARQDVVIKSLDFATETFVTEASISAGLNQQRYAFNSGGVFYDLPAYTMKFMANLEGLI